MINEKIEIWIPHDANVQNSNSVYFSLTQMSSFVDFSLNFWDTNRLKSLGVGWNDVLDNKAFVNNKYDIAFNLLY